MRSLMTVFHWLIGEVVTARVMTLRLATDLVRSGTLSVDELNGSPLSMEIINSVLGNFPADGDYGPMAQRLRSALLEIRASELATAEAALADGEIDEEFPDLGGPDTEVLYEHPGLPLTELPIDMLSGLRLKN